MRGSRQREVTAIHRDVQLPTEVKCYRDCDRKGRV